MNESAPKKTTAPAAGNQVGLLLAMGMASSEEIRVLMSGGNSNEEVVYHDVLPISITCDGMYDAKAILEEAGVKFHDVVPNEKLFQFVDLPEGWKTVRTLHDFWSWLIDDKGRKRASIFYNPKLYIRQADMRLLTRLWIEKDEQKDLEEDLAVANVTDGDKVIYSTEPIPLSKEGLIQYNQIVEAKEAARKWLNANYPDWRNPGAYWD